jgi:hypothetical protein
MRRLNAQPRMQELFERTIASRAGSPLAHWLVFFRKPAIYTVDHLVPT